MLSGMGRCKCVRGCVGVPRKKREKREKNRIKRNTKARWMGGRRESKNKEGRSGSKRRNTKCMWELPWRMLPIFPDGLLGEVPAGSPKEMSPRRRLGECLGIWEGRRSLSSALCCCRAVPGEKHPPASLTVLPVSSDERVARPGGCAFVFPCVSFAASRMCHGNIMAHELTQLMPPDAGTAEMLYR